MLAKKVKIVEVGPRDGLQNEIQNIPSDIKIEFINQLSDTGLSTIEVTSFVSANKIPQLADNEVIYQSINKKANIHYPVLVPNMQGFNDAMSAGVKEISVFGAVSETFSQKNINCSIAESIQRFQEVIIAAKKANILVRGYISCVLGCPYEGEIAPEKSAQMAATLLQLGCYEISLGDTIGVGTIKSTEALIDAVLTKVPKKNIAVHFHDTYGQALANIYAALNKGISIVDSSVAGLGGCPYAKGATGNVASEDVLYLLNGLGIETGVNLDKLIQTGLFISNVLGRQTRSKVARAKQR